MIENKILCACGCGQEISRHDSQGRERFYVNGYGNKGKKFFEEHRKNISLSKIENNIEECVDKILFLLQDKSLIFRKK